jgi:hypothetical protein
MAKGDAVLRGVCIGQICCCLFCLANAGCFQVLVLLTCRLEVVVYALPLQDDKAREPVVHLRVVYDGWLPWKLTPPLHASRKILLIVINPLNKAIWGQSQVQWFLTYTSDIKVPAETSISQDLIDVFQPGMQRYIDQSNLTKRKH